MPRLVHKLFTGGKVMQLVTSNFQLFVVVLLLSVVLALHGPRQLSLPLVAKKSYLLHRM